MANQRKVLDRGFGPYYDKDSKILILGSFPSPLSRKEKFYYANPNNRFWKVLGKVYGTEIPDHIEGKKAFLKTHHLALYDVIERCSIIGAEDSKIQDVQYADLSIVFNGATIQKVPCLGKKAYDLYVKRYGEGTCLYLPSTSGANAVFSLDRLVDEFRKVLLPSDGSSPLTTVKNCIIGKEKAKN